MRRCILDCEQSIHHEVWELRARVSKNIQHLTLSQFDSIGLGVGGKGNYSIIGYHNTIYTDAHKKQTCLLHSKFWGPIPAVSMDDGSTPLHMISRLSSCQPRNQPRFGGMAAATASVETSRRVCVCVCVCVCVVVVQPNFGTCRCCWPDVLKLSARLTANVLERQIQVRLENFPFRYFTGVYSALEVLRLMRYITFELTCLS